MPEAFSPYDFTARMLRYWKLVILMMVVGGLTGWLIHLSRPPVYESQASISFAFNIARYGLPPQNDEDHAMGAAGTIIASSPVPEYVYQQALQQSIQGLEPYSFGQSVFIERKSFEWVIRVRNPDPSAAAFIANTWAQRAYQELLTAAQHAGRADSLQVYLTSLESCLERMAVTAPATAQCSFSGLPDLLSQMQATGAELAKEQALGRGLLPFLIFGTPEKASAAQQPAQFGSNTLVLAGILIGFLLAVFFVAADVPLALAKRMQHAPASAEPHP